MRRVILTLALVAIVGIGVASIWIFFQAREIGQGLDALGRSVDEMGRDLGEVGEGLAETGESLADALASMTPRRSCAKRVPFEPTYLPKSFSRKPRCGSGGERGTPPKQQITGAILHYSGTGHIDVIRGDYQYAQSHKRRIQVLGSTGVLGDIHEGYSVRFTFRGKRYTLAAYTGPLPRSELRKFAEGLRPRPR